jgi:Lysozyme like domain
MRRYLIIPVIAAALAGCASAAVPMSARTVSVQAPYRAVPRRAEPYITPAPRTFSVLSHYDCAQLEALWVDAGGSPRYALSAAQVATAESGGDPYAVSPTDDFGLWQVNGSWGPVLATENPQGNARAAVYISHDGTDWAPWTTWRDGESGRECLLQYCYRLGGCTVTCGGCKGDKVMT